jgi:type VI secretion system FHA domain protein
MVLVLSVLRCPEQAVPEQRRVPGGEYVMGRGTECDWPLRDPDRVLSKRHCTVEYLSGAWQVRDLSTNGTFLNSNAEPVGRDQVRVLRDGDRLRLGAYEIECRVEEEAGYGEGRWQSATAAPDPMAPAATPVSDIFSAPLPGLSAGDSAPSGHAPLLPSDFDPFAPDDHGPAMPDHRPSTNDVFTPPRATMPDMLPTNWDAPVAPKPAAPSSDPFANLPDPFADAAPGAPAPRHADPFAAPIPDPFAAPPVTQPTVPLGDPFADLGPPPARPAPPLPDPLADIAPTPAPPAPVAPPLGDPFADVPPPPHVPQPSAPGPFARQLEPAPGASRRSLPRRAAAPPPPAPAVTVAVNVTPAAPAVQAATCGRRSRSFSRPPACRHHRPASTPRPR